MHNLVVYFSRQMETWTILDKYNDNIVIRVNDTPIVEEELQLSPSQVQAWSLLQLSESQVQTICS